jgi:hypothetical protein
MMVDDKKRKRKEKTRKRAVKCEHRLCWERVYVCRVAGDMEDMTYRVGRAEAT